MQLSVCRFRRLLVSTTTALAVVACFAGSAGAEGSSRGGLGQSLGRWTKAETWRDARQGLFRKGSRIVGAARLHKARLTLTAVGLFGVGALYYAGTPRQHTVVDYPQVPVAYAQPWVSDTLRWSSAACTATTEGGAHVVKRVAYQQPPLLNMGVFPDKPGWVAYLDGKRTSFFGTGINPDELLPANCGQAVREASGRVLGQMVQ